MTSGRTVLARHARRDLDRICDDRRRALPAHRHRGGADRQDSQRELFRPGRQRLSIGAARALSAWALIENRSDVRFEIASAAARMARRGGTCASTRRRRLGRSRDRSPARQARSRPDGRRPAHAWRRRAGFRASRRASPPRRSLVGTVRWPSTTTDRTCGRAPRRGPPGRRVGRAPRQNPSFEAALNRPPMTIEAIVGSICMTSAGLSPVSCAMRLATCWPSPPPNMSLSAAPPAVVEAVVLRRACVLVGRLVRGIDEMAEDRAEASRSRPAAASRARAWAARR